MGRPEDLLGQGPLAQVDGAVMEQVPGLVAIKQDIVETLLEIANGQVVQGFHHVMDL